MLKNNNNPPQLHLKWRCVSPKLYFYGKDAGDSWAAPKNSWKEQQKCWIIIDPPQLDLKLRCVSPKRCWRALSCSRNLLEGTSPFLSSPPASGCIGIFIIFPKPQFLFILIYCPALLLSLRPSWSLTATQSPGRSRVERRRRRSSSPRWGGGWTQFPCWSYSEKFIFNRQAFGEVREHLTILVLKMTKKYHIIWYWCQGIWDSYMVEDTRSPPLFFGQCPKENVFFAGGVPLVLNNTYNFF